MGKRFIFVGVVPSIADPAYRLPPGAGFLYAITLLASLSVLCLGTGCATHDVSLATVGPEHFSASSVASNGVLVVYTPLENPNASLDEFASPQRSGYRLLSANGTVSRHIANCNTIFDDQPVALTLPAGSYTVQALGPEHNPVSVAIVIVAGEITPVYLDGSESVQPGGGSDFVTLPNGAVVGWSARNP